jgi:glycine cleavage system H lipoate-binding protein
MEGSHYVDIFATKGVEYIIVILFLLTLVIFWRFLNKPVKAAGNKKVGQQSKLTFVEWFNLADNFFYHQGHSWMIPESGNVVRIGIDDFAQKLLGKPSGVKFPGLGSQLLQGSPGWQIEVDSKSIDILSPVNGEVIAINEEIFKSPELLNNDPYSKGWIIKARVSRLQDNKNNLLSGKMAKAWIQETINSLREKVAGTAGIMMRDGGVPLTGFARELDRDNWDSIAREFLKTG